MQKRHSDRNIYFKEQSISTKKYIIPYISEIKSINEKSLVLEVGCGEGGNLVPFVEMGCQCFGVDIDRHKINLAKQNLPINVVLLNEDIYDVSCEKLPKFDIIFLRDVIEHIPNQEKFMSFIKNFLEKDGIIFFAFPPFRMPFGGHQQILKNKFLSNLPFCHILPNPLYKLILKIGKVPQQSINSLLEIKSTGISIARFEKIIRKNHYTVLRRTDWFINPNYEIKFSLKPRKLLILNKIPFIRDFFTTCRYCIVKQ